MSKVETPTYVPHESEPMLVPDHPDSTAEPIRLTEHFFLADTDPIFNFRNRGVGPGSKQDIYQGVRLTENIIVAGVTTLPDNDICNGRYFSGDQTDHTTQEETVLPAGSLILLHVFSEAGQPTGQWYGISPVHQRDQNLQRVSIKNDENGVVSGIDQSCGSTQHTGKRQKLFLNGEFGITRNSAAREAHLADVELAMDFQIIPVCSFLGSRAYRAKPETESVAPQQP